MQKDYHIQSSISATQRSSQQPLKYQQPDAYPQPQNREAVTNNQNPDILSATT